MSYHRKYRLTDMAYRMTPSRGVSPCVEMALMSAPFSTINSAGPGVQRCSVVPVARLFGPFIVIVLVGSPALQTRSQSASKPSSWQGEHNGDGDEEGNGKRMETGVSTKD